MKQDTDIKVGDTVKVKGTALYGKVTEIKGEWEHGRSTKVLNYYIQIQGGNIMSYTRSEITKI